MPDIQFNAWQTVLVSILVLFLGQYLNKRFRFLTRFNIPEPVSSGLLVALVAVGYQLALGKKISFDLYFRDVLLIVFFTCVGLSSTFSELLRGGRPLVILFCLCVVMIFLQNGLGVTLATAMGTDRNVGLLGGSISLAGGLGTSIAWGETISRQYGLVNATEIGIACATLGLILGGISGGPIGEFLIRRHGLKHEGGNGSVQVEVKHGDEVPVSQDSFLYTMFIIGVSVGLGMYLNTFIQQTSFRLPAYVSCMFCGILLSNTLPMLFRKLDWPTKHASLDLIMEMSLGLFLSITLMSLQLINLISAAIPILVIVAAQWVMAVLFIILVIFPGMRKDYNSAVISAGAAGFMLGATPNAIANMHAVTGKYGPSHYAFIIVPLVGGFLLDLVNALVIELFLVM